MSTTTTRPARERRRTAPQRGSSWLHGWLARPLTSLHLLLGVFALLTGIGLVMVLSASSAQAAAAGSAFGMFQKQLTFVLLGSVGFYAALRTPIRVVRRLALPALVFSLFLLVIVLIPGVGSDINGTRGWLQFGGLSFEPAEAAKITIEIWGASVLATRRPHLPNLRHLLVPLLPVSAFAALLILLQPDLGVTVTLAIVVLALLWFGGLPMKLVAIGTGLAGGGALVFGLLVGPRSARITSWLNPTANLDGSGYQALQARYSLADGGWLGVGLGQSRAKWNYLPNAHNDFIFAIIGEELGLLGAGLVIALFGVLAWVGLRISARSVDPFLVLVSATTTVWLVGQAFLNIGYVTALLPVTGLQLPMISSGGTSTTLTMVMFGLLANAARHEPEAIAALRAKDSGRVSRLLRLPAPQPYVERRPLHAVPAPRRGQQGERRVGVRAPAPRPARARGVGPVRRPTGGPPERGTRR